MLRASDRQRRAIGLRRAFASQFDLDGNRLFVPCLLVRHGQLKLFYQSVGRKAGLGVADRPRGDDNRHHKPPEMPIIRLILGAVVLYAAYRLLVAPVLARRGSGGSFGRAGSQFPCARCHHAVKVFEDGALCRFGTREVFKNETHIRNCTDFRAG